MAYQSLVNEISAEEVRTPRNKSKLMPALAKRPSSAKPERADLANGAITQGQVTLSPGSKQHKAGFAFHPSSRNVSDHMAR